MAQQKRKVSKTSTKKSIDHNAIAAKIKSIPNICDEGKEAVSNLLIEFGYRPPLEREPKVGEVWLLVENITKNHIHFLVAYKTGKYYGLVSLDAMCHGHTANTYEELKENGTLSFAYKNIALFAFKHCTE